MMRLASLLLFLLVALPAAAQPGPAAVVEEFYTWHLAHRDALWDDPKPLGRWVDTELLDELVLASRRSRYDSSGPLDFDPFTFSQAGPNRYRLQGVQVQGETATALVQLSGGRAGDGAPPLEVTLRRRDGTWLIANVDLPGEGVDLVSLLDEMNRDFRPDAPPREVGALAYSPDGRWAVHLGFADQSGTSYAVTLIDLDAGRIDARLPFGSSTMGELAFSDDGRFLAAAQGGAVVVWDTATRQRVARLAGVDFRFATFLPGGSLLTLDSAGGLVEWEVPSGRQVRVGYSGQFDPTGWAIAPGGNRVLTAGDGASTVWLDRTSRNPQVTFPGTARQFLPGDHRLLVQRGDEVVVLDPTGQTTLASRSGQPLFFAVRPDGRAIAWPRAEPSAEDLVEI